MVNKHIILSLIILSFSCNYKNNFPTEINSKENKLIKDSIDILNFKGKKVKIDINGNNYIMIEYSFDLVNLHKESINIGISDNNFLDLFNIYYEVLNFPYFNIIYYCLVLYSIFVDTS